MCRRFFCCIEIIIFRVIVQTTLHLDRALAERNLGHNLAAVTVGLHQGDINGIAVDRDITRDDRQKFFLQFAQSLRWETDAIMHQHQLEAVARH